MKTKSKIWCQKLGFSTYWANSIRLKDRALITNQHKFSLLIDIVVIGGLLHHKALTKREMKGKVTNFQIFHHIKFNLKNIVKGDDLKEKKMSIKVIYKVKWPRKQDKNYLWSRDHMFWAFSNSTINQKKKDTLMSAWKFWEWNIKMKEKLEWLMNTFTGISKSISS